MTRIADSPAAILSAWTAVEVLSPPGFREPQDLATGDRRTLAPIDDRAVPWEADGEPARPNTRLYYQVLLGTLSLDAAMKRLWALHPQAATAETRTIPGRAVLAAVLLDHRGVPIRDNAVAVSSFAWGLPRALAGEVDLLSAWPQVERQLNSTLATRLRQTDSGGEPLPLTAGIIRGTFDWLVAALGLPSDVVEAPRHAVRVYEPQSRKSPPAHVLLNSFPLSSLATATEQFRSGSASQTLKLFLGSIRPGHRRDLLNDRTALRAAVRPALFSPARWPGPGRLPLVLLQQAAVNMALSELKEHGILAVNGPPGTGKTTLLRDIVAGLVTERARVMASFDDPATAFRESGQFVRAGNGRFQVHRLDARLRGFEILVASSNNKAVENISAELPGAAAVARDAAGLRYFKTTSDALQTSQRGTWGLIAAVLGNALNRNHFKQIFWWDRDVGLSAYLQAASGKPQTIRCVDPLTGAVSERLARVVTEEQAPLGREEALARWRQARRVFQQALQRSQQRLGEIDALSVLHDAEEAASDALHREAQAHAGLQSHLELRPTWREILFLTPHSRAWRRLADLKRLDLCAASTAVRDARTKVTTLRAAAPRSLEAVRQRLGGRVVDERFFARPRTDYQQEAPWLDDDTHRLRDEVFTAAMALHKAFIDVAARPIRHNLGALMSVLGTGASDDPDLPLAELWAALFLVVPVVSTTFASLDRMLGTLPPESLGWLLIDEAGQAPPQAALGALMKTRRAVIVGDPMQIEPVVTLPAALTQTICRRLGVDPERFNAPVASIQTLADAATSCMATFEGQCGLRTVGVPLLIHRRCAEPMFGLSNAVAYDRLMINARSASPSAIRAHLGPSRWLDVRDAALEKWCPQEGHCVVALLRALAHAGIEPDLYVVTPFVGVQDGLREVLLDSAVLQDWVSAPRDWVRQRVGTVHVAQGREAEAVIFVLGAQGSQHQGARNWAGGRPNILNVAVSRAREALYVVGNRALWRSAGLFSELDALLPQSVQMHSLLAAS